MGIARSVGKVLRDHVTLELEAIDRMYLNIYVPHLQTAGAVAGYLRGHRGQRFASTAAVAPMTAAFVDTIEQFVADQKVDLVSFGKGQHKDDITQDYLQRFSANEGVLYVGKAQERARVMRRNGAAAGLAAAPIRGSSKAPRWSITTTSTASTRGSDRSS